MRVSLLKIFRYWQWFYFTIKKFFIITHSYLLSHTENVLIWLFEIFFDNYLNILALSHFNKIQFLQLHRVLRLAPPPSPLCQWWLGASLEMRMEESLNKTPSVRAVLYWCRWSQIYRSEMLLNLWLWDLWRWPAPTLPSQSTSRYLLTSSTRSLDLACWVDYSIFALKLSNKINAFLHFTFAVPEQIFRMWSLSYLNSYVLARIYSFTGEDFLHHINNSVANNRTQ